MANAFIDGTIEAATVKRAVKRQTVFDTISIRLDDGAVRTFKRPIAATDLAGMLTPGARGRFYTFKVLDQAGICGVRLGDGRTLFAFPRTLETLMGILAALNLLLLLVALALDGEVRLLPLIVGAFTAIAYLLFRSARSAAERQFAADAAGLAPAAQ